MNSIAALIDIEVTISVSVMKFFYWIRFRSCRRQIEIAALPVSTAGLGAQTRDR